MKRWHGSVAAAGAALLLGLAFHFTSAQRIAEPAPRGQARPVARPTQGTTGARSERAPVPVEEDTDVGEGDEWVADWDPAQGRNPEVIWEKEVGGFKVSVNEAGMVQMNTAAVTGDTNTPEDVFQKEVPQKLLQEARRVMHEKLPMVTRSVWEARQAEQARAAEAAAAEAERPVDPAKFGYASLEAMKDAYRRQAKLRADDDIELFVTKDEQGKDKVSVRVSAFIPAS